ncbi:MAG TPA: hypothetical protein VF444_20830 [Pseudonocardiaceae bacterium]
MSERISRDPTTDVRVVPSRPGNTEIDPLLAALGDRRLVVVGTDADLAAVVLRLLRTERLAAVPVGFVPVTGESAAAEVWGLPTGVGAAVDVAFGAEPDRAPLIRDDNGGVLVGVGTLRGVRGVGYCDDERVLRGPARSISVSPDPAGAGLTVAVRGGGLFGGRLRVSAGRSFELGCLPTFVVRDGVRFERPVRRWTWYRHTEDLRLVRGLPTGL